MIKSEQNIERDFYSLIANSELGNSVKGGIYRDGMRPANSAAEDLVLKFLSGMDNQIQTGIVIINLYVPDITYSEHEYPVKDNKRIAELEDLLLSFVNDNKNSEYWIETDSSPVTMLDEQINQHLIYARIAFRRSTS